MKKLLIGLCAASLLAASGLGYASSVTLVNVYHQPVTFVVSKGPIYNPVVSQTLWPGEKTTISTEGSFGSNYNFMAYSPSGSSIVTNCGTPFMSMDNVMVKAGWSRVTGMFGCRIYDVQKPCPHKYHHHHHDKHKTMVTTTHTDMSKSVSVSK